MAYLMDPSMDGTDDYWSQFSPSNPNMLQTQVQPGSSTNPTAPTLPFVRSSPQLPVLPQGVTPGQSTTPPQDFGNLNDPATWMALVNDPAKLTAWIRQNNPGWSDQLVNYYAGVIKGQPGADATEQAGSANYYLDKFKQDPFYGGSQGGYAPGGFGSLNQMDTAQFGGINSVTDPGYQFRLGEGLKAIQGSAFARGTGLSGGTLKALTNYATGAANQAYGDDWQRAYQQFMGNYGVRSGERNALFSRNYSLANLGLNAANS